MIAYAMRRKLVSYCGAGAAAAYYNDMLDVVKMLAGKSQNTVRSALAEGHDMQMKILASNHRAGQGLATLG